MQPLTDFNEWPKFSVYDIEAENWVQVICLCHLDEYGNKKKFDNVSQYMDWLYSKEYQGSLVWAHWGGHYDHRFIIHEATKRGWAWHAVISGNLIIIVNIRDDKGREIKFCESARLMPDSVAKIGKAIGLEKLDVDRTKIESYSMDTIIEYCFRDCEIVLEGLKSMREVFLSIGCDFAFTLASISTRYVRRSGVLEWHKFYTNLPGGGMEYKEEMLIADEFCLPAYFGGRVEVFKAGTFKNLYYYDITSSYPWSMTHDLPAYFTGFKPPAKRLTDALQNYGISEASVTIPSGSLYAPVLALKYKNKLVFPEGSFRGRWTNIELLALWERGRHKGVKIEIHAQANFEPLPFLRPFVDTFFNLRKKAMENKDDFRGYAYKIALNSLYGKLVEAIERRSIVFGDMVNEVIEKHGESALTATPTPGVYALMTKADGPFRHVAAGCYVTARSRLLLLEGIEKCLAAGAKVYYCDTDSIMTDKPVFPQLNEKRLGEYNLEMKIAEAEIYCPKVYKLTTDKGKVIYKAKGMPIKGLSDEDSENRWRAFTQKFKDLELDKPAKEGIAGFLTDLNKGSTEPRAYSLQRIMLNSDSKRTHTGEDSLPIMLNLG